MSDNDENQFIDTIQKVGKGTVKKQSLETTAENLQERGRDDVAWQFVPDTVE